MAVPGHYQLRDLFAEASQYLDGKSNLPALNGIIGDLREYGRMIDTPESFETLLDEWSEMVDRRWNEWGTSASPISETEFAVWLRQQLVLGPSAPG